MTFRPTLVIVVLASLALCGLGNAQSRRTQISQPPSGIPDTSPVQDRIKQLKNFAFPDKIEFSACNNTKVMEKREGQPIAILPEAHLVPSGVVTLMELQEQGWSYVRP